MGKILRTFANRNYKNEDEIAHKFVLPFLRDFLGYQHLNFFFKKRYKVGEAFKTRTIPINRNKTIEIKDLQAEPDVIVVNDRERKKIFRNDNEDKALFFVEIKGPNQKIEKHTKQKNAYHLVVQSNISILTNGFQFHIYDFNELILKCETLEEIDLKFPSISAMLHKRHQFDSFLEKISEFQKTIDAPFSRNIDFTDFRDYIKEHFENDYIIHALNEEIVKIRDYQIFYFNLENGENIGFNGLFERIESTLKNEESNDNRNSPQMEGERDKKTDEKRASKLKKLTFARSYLLEGDSGVGKSVLLRHLQRSFVKKLISSEIKKLPILLELKYWTENSDLENFVLNELHILSIDLKDIQNHLKDGNISLFLDGFDELDTTVSRDFFKKFELFKRNYPKIPVILTTRKHIVPSHFKENFSEVISLEPPMIEDLRTHVQNNLNSDAEDFFNHIQEKNLSEFVNKPLLLNYLIIYYGKFSSFPNSIFEILKELTRAYFEDHLKTKQLAYNNDLLELPNKILCKLSFEMLYNLKSNNLYYSQFHSILASITSPLRRDFEIKNSLTDDDIEDFFINTNYIIKEKNQYRFWHDLLLNYFGSIEFVDRINRNALKYDPSILFHDFKLKELIVISFPFIDNDEYTNNLKKTNSFLYVESFLQKSNANLDEKMVIKKVLLEKLNSKYRAVRTISLELLTKYLRTVDDTFSVLKCIFEKYTRSEILIWIMESIGKLGGDDARNFLISNIDKINQRMDFNVKQIRETIMSALSNYGDKFIQDILINELEQEWRGVDYLKTIGDALALISDKNKLTENSKNKIKELYRKPKDFGLNISENHHIREDGLKKIMFSIGKQEDIMPLLFNIIDKEYLDVFCHRVESLAGSVLRKHYLPDIIKIIKDDTKYPKYRESYANILRHSSIQIEFNVIMDLLYHFKEEGVDVEKFDIDLLKSDIKTFKEKFPSYQLSYTLHLILERLLDDNNILNFKTEELADFLLPYRNYPHEFVLESTYDLLAKYKIEALLEIKQFFLNRSLIKLLKPFFSLDVNRSKEIITIYFNKYFEEPEKYHDYLLMGQLIELLLDNGEIEQASELFEKYICRTDSFENLSFTLGPLNKFSSEISLDFLKIIKKKILESDNPIKNLDSFIFGLNFSKIIIDSEDYIIFCLDLADLLDKEHDFLIGYLFQIIMLIKPQNFEQRIINFLKEKFSDGYRLYSSLNSLIPIGTHKTIKFLSKLLNSEDEHLRDIVFSCIKYIYERNNKLWYDGEEIFNIT
ncbi:MAG: type I restriction enzyme HsdR N-terminal domain-containing protein [Candidatus Lokiarchaeota archaeon]|nr:type I restriction enzyme HsdR N-terminal domain-containing protein [Candidatus Lokiarchaeota archaeon]